MIALPIQSHDGHLFLVLEDDLWLLDTGAPTSFGTTRHLYIAGEHFNLSTSYLGLTAATLSQFVGVQCVGLLGADVLSRFDHIFDTAGGRLTVSTSELSRNGHMVRLDEFMDIPIVTARVGRSDYRMFFDTGAQISYFQHDSLSEFPFAGRVIDFYPGVGQFHTDTHEVPFSLGGITFTLRCGTLPGVLGMTLMMAGTAGIVGNAIMSNRTVGYFPRRGTMVL